MRKGPKNGEGGRCKNIGVIYLKRRTNWSKKGRGNKRPWDVHLGGVGGERKRERSEGGMKDARINTPMNGSG